MKSAPVATAEDIQKSQDDLRKTMVEMETQKAVTKASVDASRATLDAEIAKGNDTSSERCQRILTALQAGSEIAISDLMKINVAEQKAALALLRYVAIRNTVLPKPDTLP